MAPRVVILVEGMSDRRALETLAVRRGQDLIAEGVDVLAMDGVMNIGSFLEGSARTDPTSPWPGCTTLRRSSRFVADWSGQASDPFLLT